MQNRKGLIEEKNMAIQHLYEIHEKEYIPEILESYGFCRQILTDIGQEKVFIIGLDNYSAIYKQGF